MNTELDKAVKNSKAEIAKIEAQIAFIKDKAEKLQRLSCDLLGDNKPEQVDWAAEVATGRCYVHAWDDAESYCADKVGLLIDYDPSSNYPFKVVIDNNRLVPWKHAEITTVAGVWRSFNGTECPVELMDSVIVRRSSGTYTTDRVANIDWYGSGERKVTHFCLLPANWIS